jgi:peptide/nickel transport system permease protein
MSYVSADPITSEAQYQDQYREAPLSNRRKALNRLLRNRMTMLGVAIISVYLFAALFPRVLTSYDPIAQDLANKLQTPSFEHWMGTDEFGRDVFSRVVYGARLSILVGFFAVASGGVVGFLIGMIAGYTGGVIDSIFMRGMDILLALPGIMLAIAIIAALGSGIQNVIIAIAIYNIPQFARITRSTVLAAKNQDYVLAARAVGNNTPGILLRHIFPNVWGPPFVFATLRFSTAILIAAGLSFLGLGVNPPTPEWGAMLAASRGYLRAAPHLAFAYGITLSLLVLGFNALGEGLRDVFDPRSVH